nr:MAG TPA: hypothetical protein [Caudoviricetes sp.]
MGCWELLGQTRHPTQSRALTRFEGSRPPPLQGCQRGPPTL